MISNIEKELVGVALEPRLCRRVLKISERMRKKPGLGFTQIFEDESELEGVYRFLSNSRVEFETLLKPHTEQTKERSKRYSKILVLEDTTEFVFQGEEKREGLSRLNKNNQGFLGHFALAVSADQKRIPLGILGAELYTRPQAKKQIINQHKRREDNECESLRWGRMVETVEDVLKQDVTATHVMDREGDIYDVLSEFQSQRQRRFIIRAAKNRRIESKDLEYGLLYDSLDGLPILFHENKEVSFRSKCKYPSKRRTYPSRTERVAKLAVTTTTVRIERTRNSSSRCEPFVLMNIVHVFETEVPIGEEAVEWVLLTNERTDTEDDIRWIIEAYHTRWLVEEFFKAIKTGCNFQKRQLTTYHSLKNALALMIPIAWEMLLLRTEAQKATDILAEGFIEPVRIEVLKAISKRYILKDNPTLQDVLLAIAGIGGHLKRNGLPGWLTLSRGYEQLLFAERIWKLSRQRCDQS